MTIWLSGMREIDGARSTRSLGLTVGVIQTPDSQDQRRKAYACDITYGTAKEFGFDFLRDRLLLRRMGRTRMTFWATAAVSGGTIGRATGAASSPFCAGGRGGQYSDRRGAHAADHRFAGRESSRTGGGHLPVGGGACCEI